GEQFRDNSGADIARNREHPGAQELMWGLGDYPVTPEAHMRGVRRLGATCVSEAEQAIRCVKQNADSARAGFNYMKAYKLLTEYYDRKVLAATSALIYSFGGPDSDRRVALARGDEAVGCYEAAINFIWEQIDHKSGNIKGRWLDGKPLTLPELIEREHRERASLPALFAWGKRAAVDPSKTAPAPRAGTYAPP